MWFEQLTGFAENPAAVKQLIRLETTANGQQMVSQANGKRYSCGSFEAVSLACLNDRLQQVFTDGNPAALATPTPTPRRLTLQERVADVQQLHADPANAGALFQVASQFNALEMVSPDISPDHGISDYQYDKTQGPACAIACGAGTLYRQYWLPLPASQWPTSQPGPVSLGQTRSRQLDMAAPLHQALTQALQQASPGPLWQMKNGYLLANANALRQIANYLHQASSDQRAQLRQALQIGMQWHTEVTLAMPNRSATPGHLVSQAYCSALPVAYSDHSTDLWQPFAQLVLDAAYEATLAAAVLNAQHTGNNTVFLTQLGGGAFGNRSEWIISAIERALRLYQHQDLQVVMVSYGHSNPHIAALVRRVQANPMEHMA